MNFIYRFFLKRKIQKKFEKEFLGKIDNVKVFWDDNIKQFAVRYDLIKNVTDEDRKELKEIQEKEYEVIEDDIDLDKVIDNSSNNKKYENFYNKL